MVRLFRLGILGLLTCVALASCSLSVDALNPRPNVNIAPDSRSLTLDLDQSILDEFSTKSGQLKGAKIAHWRESLQKGFEAGFRGAYSPVATGEGADLVLRITRVDLSFEPTAYLVNRYGDKVGAAAATTQITYSAQLVDSTQKVIARSANTVLSKRQFGSLDASESVESAIESMYEQIAKECFAQR